MGRVKWLPELKREDVYESAVKGYFEMKQQNLHRQRQLVEKIRENVGKYGTESEKR